MKMTRRLLFFLIPLCLSTPLLAQTQTSIPAEHPSLYKGVRPTGMGNAFLAMPGTDENAPFYNPASINDYEKKLHFRFLSPLVDFAPGSISLVKDVINLASDVDAQATDGGKVDVFRAFVDAHTGEFESVALRLPVVQVMHKWFFASILADSRTTISFRNRAFTNIQVLSRSDAGGVIGGAWNFKDLLGIPEDLQAGLNIKVLHRLVIDRVVTANDIVNFASFGDAVPRLRSTGVGVDFGLKGSLPTFGMKWLDILKPTAGFTWQDIGNTRFQNGVPDTQQSVSLGFAVHPEMAKWQFHVDNDFRELNQGTTFIKKWNIGAEAVPPYQWKFFKPSVRLGVNQGYIAAGTTFDFKYAKLEFSTYGVDAGVISRQKQLRRLALNLSFGF